MGHLSGHRLSWSRDREGLALLTPSSRQATDGDDSLTLLALAQDGDATALNLLVARYGPRLGVVGARAPAGLRARYQRHR